MVRALRGHDFHQPEPIALVDLFRRERPRNYPTRCSYLCGLTETEWTPHFTTIQDFTELMGEDGVRLLNEYGVELAVEKKLADPTTMVADTTAQEAAIPHPNEMGLMASFLRSVTAAGKRAGGAAKDFLGKTADKFEAAKKKLRDYRSSFVQKGSPCSRRMHANLVGSPPSCILWSGAGVHRPSSAGRRRLPMAARVDLPVAVPLGGRGASIDLRR